MQNGHAMGASAMMTMMMTLFLPHCLVLFCLALLCVSFALLCFAFPLLCVALLCFAFGLLCFPVLCFAFPLHCFALRFLCFALHCCALLCLALLCVAVTFFALPSGAPIEVAQKSRNVVPRGPGSHFIGCRAFLDAGAAAQVVQRCADQCWHRIRLMQYRVVQKDRVLGGSSLVRLHMQLWPQRPRRPHSW